MYRERLHTRQISTEAPKRLEIFELTWWKRMIAGGGPEPSAWTRHQHVRHAQSICISAKITKTAEEVHQHNPNKQNPPNLPIGEADGLGNVADASTIHTDVQSDENDHL